jgi:hypothetical protein
MDARFEASDSSARIAARGRVPVLPLRSWSAAMRRRPDFVAMQGAAVTEWRRLAKISISGERLDRQAAQVFCEQGVVDRDRRIRDAVVRFATN